MVTCIALSSLVKVFPDEAPRQEGFSGFSVCRGEYGAFQIAVHSDIMKTLEINVESDLDVRVFRVDCVPVQLPCHKGDDNYLRREPGLYPDVLRDCSAITASPNWQSLWFDVCTDDAEPGVHPVRVRIGKRRLTVSVTVLSCEFPAQKLLHTNWFHSDCLSTWYGVPVFSEAYWQIVEQYVRAAAAHGMNMILTPLFTPPLDTAVGKERPTVQLVDVEKNGEKYSFGFDKLGRWFEMCDRCGIKYFEMSHLFTQWGAMHAPKIMATVDGQYRQLFGWSTWAASKRYWRFLEAFSKTLCAFLEESGMADRCYFHVSDEPSIERMQEYGVRSRLIRRLFPGYPVIDALSDVDFFQKGLVETPVPSITTAENFALLTPNLWTYYCCGPESGYYPNRFIAMPSARVRILGMLMYRYQVVGFLHWGLNFWYSVLSDHPIDPFRTTDAEGNFPAGDPFVLYPGDGGQPLISLRLKVFRQGLQDQRALELLESLVGRERTLDILCGGETLTFSSFPWDDAWLLETRERINKEIEKAYQERESASCSE